MNSDRNSGWGAQFWTEATAPAMISGMEPSKNKKVDPRWHVVSGLCTKMGAILVSGDQKFYLKHADCDPGQGTDHKEGAAWSLIRTSGKDRGSMGRVTEALFAPPRAVLAALTTPLENSPPSQPGPTESPREVLKCATFYSSHLFCWGNQPSTATVPRHES